ncbi:MAG: hypothetical protein FJ096_07285 [Deltaproteobacteria bacterium]|nr:hypothetical protein [Deltaproteobacteria bacterium]
MTSATPERLRLLTPPLPCLVPEGVFDEFGWCASDFLELRRDARWETRTPTSGVNPAGLAFILSHTPPYLPRELAKLHVGALASDDEWALAPYAIDDATDALCLHRARPREVLSLAATNLDALMWGLHDWCHFHNHGPFTEPAWTEVQCDASALVWLWQNRAALGLDEGTWEARRAQLERVASQRFESEGLGFDAGCYARGRLITLAEA